MLRDIPIALHHSRTVISIYTMFASISSLLLSQCSTTVYKKAATPTIPSTTPVKPPAATASAAPVNCAGRDAVTDAEPEPEPEAERVALPPVATDAMVVPAVARLDADARTDEATEAADEARLDAAEDADAATDEARLDADARIEDAAPAADVYAPAAEETRDAATEEAAPAAEEMTPAREEMLGCVSMLLRRST
jgi:hypothetical protein